MSEKRINRAKAIRLKCLDCSLDQPSEVKQCTVTRCPLWRYRMGTEERDELYSSTHKPRMKKNHEEINS